MRMLLLGALGLWLTSAGMSRQPSAAQQEPAPGVPTPGARAHVADGPWEGPGLEETLLVVDGEEVPFSRFAEWLLAVQGVELQERFLDRMILSRAVRQLGVAPTAEDVARATKAALEQRIALGFHGDRALYEAELARIRSTQALDFEHRSVILEDQLARDALAVATRPRPREAGAEEALAAAYTRRYGADGRELVVRAIRLRPVLPQPGPNDDEAERQRRVEAAREAVEARLRGLAGRIRAGADVAELAREASEDPDSRLVGGRLPAPFVRAAWPRAVNEALAQLAPGEPSAPLFAQGYFNLFVIESARAVALDEARAALERELATAPPDEFERRAAFARLRAEVFPHIVWHSLEEDADGPLALRGRPQTLAAPFASIGDETWTRADLALWIARERGADLARPFVRDLRLERRAAARSVAASPEAIEARAAATFAATLRQVYGGDRARMARDMERRGITEAHLLRRFQREAWRDLTADALLALERTVSDEDVQRTWEARYGPLGKSFDVRFLVRRLTDRDAGEERARLVSIAAQASAGADFGALAARWSDDPIARANGGRPTASSTEGSAGRYRHEDAPPAIQAALARLQPGETSAPLDVGDELVLIQLVEVRRVPLGDVADALRQELETRPTTTAERMGLLMSFDMDADATFLAERLFRPAAPERGAEERASER
ncbi:MAG: peptidylprolyl isomerase [Planctomycetota bacterium]